MVEIFRNSEAAGPITDEALALDPPPKVIWMQLSVRNDAAAARAEARGVTVVMNRCPKIEFGRLSGEISWQGVNSRILSAKKPALAGKGFQKLQPRPPRLGRAAPPRRPNGRCGSLSGETARGACGAGATPGRAVASGRPRAGPAASRPNPCVALQNRGRMRPRSCPAPGLPSAMGIYAC